MKKITAYGIEVILTEKEWEQYVYDILVHGTSFIVFNKDGTFKVISAHEVEKDDESFI